MSAPEKETWIDPVTGLEWQSQSPGEKSWHDAQRFARKLGLGGHGDWRLPSAAELESLLDRRRYRPVVREEVPFRPPHLNGTRKTRGS